MRGILFAFVFGLLVWDASGLDALVTSEPCVELSDTAPDNACPPTCVRCACAQPIVTTPINMAVTATRLQSPLVEVAAVSIPLGPPRDIFHIPKTTPLTL